MLKRVFCVTYGAGHVNIIKEIYNELIKYDNLEVSILGLTLADSILKKENIPHKRISQYLNLFDSKEQIIELGKQFLDEDSNNCLIEREDTIAYHGLSLYDLKEEYGDEKAWELYEKLGRKAFLPINTMYKILEYEAPDVVVTTNSPRMEKAAAIAANMLNIPVVRINDLPYMSEKMEYDAKLCVMNELAKQSIIRKGLAREEDIVVTGQPVFEKDLKINKDVQEEYLKKYKNDYQYIVLYLGQGHSEQERLTICKLGDISNDSKNTLFIIRPHPNDDSDYTKYGKTDNFLVTKEGDLKYLLAISDAAVTRYSTSGLQAALLGVPLICMDIEGNNEFDFSELGIAIKIKDIENLESIIKKCMDKQSCEYLALEKGRLLFKNTDGAAQNISGVIIKSIR